MKKVYEIYNQYYKEEADDDENYGIVESNEELKSKFLEWFYYDDFQIVEGLKIDLKDVLKLINFDDEETEKRFNNINPSDFYSEYDNLINDLTFEIISIKMQLIQNYIEKIKNDNSLIKYK